MDLNEYQAQAQQTAQYPGKGKDLSYPALGLNGEAGAVADKLKKIIRDHQGEFSAELREDLAYELGDVLWYVSELAFELGYTLESIAEMNIKKLSSRAIRGRIQGNGDHR